ncbi:MAG: CocE/NonD family hydrolase [Roseovarius sp.]
MITDMDFGIPLPDGTRLSARIWMPDTAKTEPVPAILEYLPYRKSDGTIDRDETMHPWFAQQGYACLRVDRRGTGDSEGTYDDEYSEQELQDGEAVIAWIAQQSWCTGRVGMQGISWGGFNSLQLAARKPPALKAIVSIGTTVDRYMDDIHYKGGIQLGENIGWAATASSWFSAPPNPNLREDWRETWLSRLESAPFLAERWTQQSDRSSYWKHGSVSEDYSELEAAVLVMGGQHDGYRNAMAALLEHAESPVKAIMGPWGHKYPHISTIGPSIDYLNVALRWWDKWLKNAPNTADDDPAYRVYLVESETPDPSFTKRAGRWLAFETWPAPEIHSISLPFGDGILGQKQAFCAKTESDLKTGQACGEFFPFGFGPGELPDEQSSEDERSVCFDSAGVEDMSIVGAPVVSLRLACDAKRGQIIVRLNDVRPDGSVALISLGMLDLRYRNGFDQKIDLDPDVAFDVALTLDQCAYHLPKGHALRVAISTSYWPFCWPESTEFQVSVTAGSLEIPVVSGDVPETQFHAPNPIEPREVTQLRKPAESKTWQTQPDGTITLDIIGDHGARLDATTGLTTQSKVHEHWSIHPKDPASASVLMSWDRGFSAQGCNTKTKVVMQMRGKSDAFLIEEHVQAWESDELVFNRRRTCSIPR